MIVVTNRISVTAGWEERFEARFEGRARLVEGCPGFVRNELHRPTPMRYDREAGSWSPDPEGKGVYEVKTWWRCLDDFTAWMKGPAFAEAHKDRAPRGMFDAPNALEIHEILQSTDLDLEGGGGAE